MKKIVVAFLLLLSFSQSYTQKINRARIQEMYNKIKAAGIRHPEFVIAQSLQETGFLNCKKCCLRFNNLFGFYVNGNNCKKFQSEDDCIAYYKTWQDKRYDRWRAKYPKADYYHFLKYVQYATGDKYNGELKPKVTWVKKNLKL